ncbi:MAG: hypothetical protein WD342_10215 [Verrucomicrobiales bacterium]
MAKRYDQKTKDEVVSFIENYNTEHGRGGQAAASKKYNLNPITIKSWLQKAGVKTPGKSGKKTRGGARKAKAARTPQATGTSQAAPQKTSVSGTRALEKMIKIRDQIASLEREYDELKAKL